MHRIILITTICFLILSCNSESYDGFSESGFTDKALSLQKVDEFTLHSSEHTLGRLRYDFTSNRDNTVFAFYDQLQHQFILSDERGLILNVLSEQGQGPGEIIRAAGFA
ncbi:MAG: hypothetical protein ACNA78_10950, partial [Balneolaceae bacterium]